MFAFNFPSLDALQTIYSQILNFHFQQQAFGPSLLRSGPSLIQATITFHQMMTHHFLPTVVKFHYLFNLRDLSNVFQVPWWLWVLRLGWRNDNGKINGVQLWNLAQGDDTYIPTFVCILWCYTINFSVKYAWQVYSHFINGTSGFFQVVQRRSCRSKGRSLTPCSVYSI